MSKFTQRPRIARPPAMSVDALQTKMQDALTFDQRKTQINDAKLRAVAQKVEYDEFEKMVAGAHLKPVKPCSKESADISKQFSGFVMPAYAPQAADAASSALICDALTYCGEPHSCQSPCGLECVESMR